MKSLFNRIKMNMLYFRLAKEPTRTDLIFTAVEIASKDPDQKALAKIEKEIFSHPGFKEMYDDGYMPRSPSLEELKVYAPGTFGNALYVHLAKNGLTLETFPNVDVLQPIDYVTARIYRDHDLWHALFGYGVTVEDEMALQAFGAAQYNSPLASFIISAALLHLLKTDSVRTGEGMKKIVEGYHLGQRTKFILEIKLHEYFGWPLEDVRKICSLDSLRLERVTMEYGAVN
ncbi:MAG: Coq4 family protein [Bdellovibrionota bacterium]